MRINWTDRRSIVIGLLRLVSAGRRSERDFLTDGDGEKLGERRLVMRQPAAVEMLKSWQQAEMSNNIVDVCRDGASTNNKTQGIFSAVLLVNTL